MKEFEPIPIENLEQFIKKTSTYQKYVKTNTIIIGDGLYTIEFEFDNFHVRVYSSKLKSSSLEYNDFWDAIHYKGEKEKCTEHNKVVGFAKFLFDQIMKEVIEMVREENEMQKM